MVHNSAGADKPAKHKLKLKGSIGKGAFGEIYKGLLDGDVVAVKTMAGSEQGLPSDSELTAEMFFREAEMLRGCSHKRIIGYRALMRMPASSKAPSGATWALVMEYAKHGNLGQRVVQNMIHPGRTSYNIVQALGWALDIASALEYLHMRSPAVLHRDVKSANIMLTEEEGVMVAKLSDFGLHVTADTTKTRALQTSALIGGLVTQSMTNKGGSNITSHTNAVAVTPVNVTAGATPSHSGSSSAKTPDSSAHTNTSSSAGADSAAAADGARQPLQMLNGEPLMAPSAAAAAADEHDLYSEVHDSEGSRVYRETQYSTSGAVPANSATAAAAAKKGAPARRSNSFKRATHHPPGEALPRLFPNNTSSLTAAAADLESAADANARLFAHWRGGSNGSSADGSMCSMVTEGTWATQGTAASCTDTAGSDCTDDTAGSIWEEVETVFNMTGRTGSCLYMAPEVYQAHNYNEKSDVFSFGVVLYELFARCLIVFTELPTNSTNPEVPQWYAAKVSGGYRPSRPKAMPDNVWALISACWQQDPLLRPHMSEVVAVLSAALTEEVTSQLNKGKRRSLSFSRKSPISSSNSTTTAAAAAGGGGGGLSAVLERSGAENSSSNSTAAPAAAGAAATASGRRSFEGRQPKPTAAAEGAAGVADAATNSDAAAHISSKPAGAGAQSKKGQGDVPASQGCGCVIC